MNWCPDNSVSVVVPILNEFESIPHLYVKLVAALESTTRPFELIFVDDGSTDGSPDQLGRLADADDRVRVVVLRRNFGQTAAMRAGMDAAVGDYVVTIDGDLQNEPADIPMMLDRLDEGVDLVHGWRRDRKDKWLSRRLPSMIANWVIARVTRFPVHDLGCTLKAMRREISEELELYGEMHRFIPILAHSRGAKCLEVVTTHHPRLHGKTKYGIDRTLRVFIGFADRKVHDQLLCQPDAIFWQAWCRFIHAWDGGGRVDAGDEIVWRRRHDR